MKPFEQLDRNFCLQCARVCLQRCRGAVLSAGCRRVSLPSAALCLPGRIPSCGRTDGRAAAGWAACGSGWALEAGSGLAVAASPLRWPWGPLAGRFVPSAKGAGGNLEGGEVSLCWPGAVRIV